jgi:hypothetical protein
VSTYNLASRRGAFWRWASSVFAYKFGSFLLENSLNRLREVGITDADVVREFIFDFVLDKPLGLCWL